MDAEFEELPKEEYFPVEMDVEAIPSVPLAQLNEGYIVHPHGSELRSPEYYTVTEGISVARIGVATAISTTSYRSLHNHSSAIDMSYGGNLGTGGARDRILTINSRGTGFTQPIEDSIEFDGTNYYLVENGVRRIITHDEFSSLQGRPIRYVSGDNTSSPIINTSTEQECYEIDWSKVNTVEDIVTIMIALQTSFRIYKKSGEQPDIKYRDLFSRDLMKKV